MVRGVFPDDSTAQGKDRRPPEPQVGVTALAVQKQRSGSSLLSPREQEVLLLVAEGLTNKQIAAKLIVAEGTVKYYVTSVFNKLGVDTRAQAVAVAAQRDLL